MKASTRAVVGAAVAVLVAIVAAYALTQQNNEQTIMSADQTDRIVVYTTFYAIHEFTKNVIGDKATVENLIPFNVEPHDYELTPKRLVSLNNADVLVYNGADFEPFVADVIGSGSFDHLMFVDTTAGINLLTADHSEDEHEKEHDGHSLNYDPHVWLDPILAKKQVQTIADSMAKADPENAQYYFENAKAYSEKLDVLDSKVRAELATCKKDTFIPFHNAFTYFAERYGLHAEPLTGLSPEQDATAKEIQEFIEFAKENDIKYFLTEEMADTRLSEQLAREVGGQILVFSPLEGITPDEQERNVTYIEKMQDNLTNLKIALECN